MELYLTAISIIVGILSVLVTVLIGWNIYTVINFKEEVRRITEKTMSENTLSTKEVEEIFDKAFSQEK